MTGASSTYSSCLQIPRIFAGLLSEKPNMKRNDAKYFIADEDYPFSFLDRKSGPLWSSMRAPNSFRKSEVHSWRLKRRSPMGSVNQKDECKGNKVISTAILVQIIVKARSAYSTPSPHPMRKRQSIARPSKCPSNIWNCWSSMKYSRGRRKPREDPYH